MYTTKRENVKDDAETAHESTSVAKFADLERMYSEMPSITVEPGGIAWDVAQARVPEAYTAHIYTQATPIETAARAVTVSQPAEIFSFTQ